jgi:hypothetical protein
MMSAILYVNDLRLYYVKQSIGPLRATDLISPSKRPNRPISLRCPSRRPPPTRPQESLARLRLTKTFD